MTVAVVKRLLVVVGLLVVCACQASTEVADDQPTAPTREPVAAVEPTASTVGVPDPSPTATEAVEPAPTATSLPPATPEPTPTPVPTPEPTETPVPTPTVAVADADHSGLAGTRGLTLQWISWEPEDWGVIEFVPLVDGSYAVSGAQTGTDGDVVSVEGTIVRVSDRELLFTGEVVVQVRFNNNGQPCVRSGDITFLATGDRRFWRMQNLLNCDGIVTDYVDIYFG